MESTQNLLNELISIKERYERLLGRFNEFAAEILAVMKVDERLAGMELIVNDDNSLKVRYLDRELIAKFSLLIDNDGNRKGVLTCITAGRAGSEVFDMDDSGGSTVAAGGSLNFAW
jgi:hypothetical protein